jgi:hypothetical protein
LGALVLFLRTAASAALAAEHISPNPFKGILVVIGTGVIARTTVQWLLFRNWRFLALRPAFESGLPVAMYAPNSGCPCGSVKSASNRNPK